ncbi:MAG: potassium transporter TrkG, partial [Methanobacterium sp.]
IIMIIGATNFALHYTVLKGNWREYFKDIETKVAYPLLIIGTLIIAVFLYNSSTYGHDLLLSLRYSVFQVVSALTTTGLQTASPDEITYKWTGLGIFILTILMIIGAGACSTGGGLKWLRIGILVKGMWWEVKQLLVPRRAKIPQKIHHVRDLRVSGDILKLTGLFVFTYLSVYIISVIIVLFYYPNVAQTLFEVASATSNVGLSSGLISSTSPVVVKLVFIIDFWVGRLEIWPVLLLIAITAVNIARR